LPQQLTTINHPINSFPNRIYQPNNNFTPTYHHQPRVRNRAVESVSVGGTKRAQDDNQQRPTIIGVTVVLELDSDNCCCVVVVIEQEPGTGN
jgi:hypothetical protein